VTTGQRSNGYATAAVVLGAIGVPTAVFFLGGVFGVMAVTLGLLGLGRVKRGEADGRAMAFAGVGLGIVATLVAGAMVYVVYGAHTDIDGARDCFRNAKTQEDFDACRDVFGQDAGD
jgi:ABC-type cobalamin transport system permease subunit